MDDIEQIFNDIGNYINTTVPGIDDNTLLYHYTDIAGLNGIITKNSFWLTQREFMNDIAEPNYAKEIIFQTINENKDIISIFNESLITNNAYNKEYILSFSLEKDSIHHWNYYSNGEGYCLAITKGEIYQKFKNKKLNSMYFGPVIYKKEEQIELIKLMISIYKIMLTSEDLYQKYISTFQNWLFAFYGLFKQYNHSCEKEFRLIVQDPNYEVKFRIKKNIYTPYIDIENINLHIKHIWLGPKLELEIAEKGLSSFLLNNHFLYGTTIIPSEIKMR